MLNLNLLSIYSILPEFILAIGILALTVLFLFSENAEKNVHYLSALLLTIVAVLVYFQKDVDANLFYDFYENNYWIRSNKLILLIFSIFMILVSMVFFSNKNTIPKEYFLIYLISIFGGLFVFVSQHFLMIIIGIETVSICSYLMAVVEKQRIEAIESSIKYFMIGALASGLILYGIALIYGATGSFHLGEIQQIATHQNNKQLFIIGIILIISGFFIKLAVVPFHMWFVDVVDGTSLPVSLYFATLSKITLFLILFKILIYAFSFYAEIWLKIILWLSVISMFFGSFYAMKEMNLKRLLAFSSISHTGYILLCFLSFQSGGTFSFLIYLISYAFMTIGCYTVIILLTNTSDNPKLQDLAGLASKHPILSFVLVIFVLSFIGIPLTAGFMAKYLVFTATIKAGFILIVVAAIINSVLSFYYYSKFIIFLYFYPTAYNNNDNQIRFNTNKIVHYFIILLCLTGTLFIGIYPDPIISIALKAQQAFFLTY